MGGGHHVRRTAVPIVSKHREQAPDRSPVQCAVCPMRNVGVYSCMGIEGWKTAAKIRSREIEVPAGHLIVEAGRPADTVYAVRSGWAAQYAHTKNNKRQILDIVLPGGFIGYEALGSGSWPYPVRSLTSMWLCVFDRTALFSAMVSTLESSRNLAVRCIDHLGLAQDHLINIGTRSSISRIAHVILRLQARLRDADSTISNQFEFPLRRDDLADLLGITPVHVSRSLTKLRSLRAADVSNGIVTVIGERRLREIARDTASRN